MIHTYTSDTRLMGSLQESQWVSTWASQQVSRSASALRKVTCDNSLCSGCAHNLRYIDVTVIT